MRLTNRFTDILISRLNTHLPTVTTWDSNNVICSEENFSYTPDNIEQGMWQLTGKIKGSIDIDLHSENIQQLPIENIIEDLLKNLVHIQPDDQISIGGLTELGRFTLHSWKKQQELENTNTSNNASTIGTLTFNVKGAFVRMLETESVPQLLFGEAPRIGRGFENDYTPIESFIQGL